MEAILAKLGIDLNVYLGVGTLMTIFMRAETEIFFSDVDIFFFFNSMFFYEKDPKNTNMTNFLKKSDFDESERDDLILILLAFAGDRSGF